MSVPAVKDLEAPVTAASGALRAPKSSNRRLVRNSSLVVDDDPNGPRPLKSPPPGTHAQTRQQGLLQGLVELRSSLRTST